MGEKTYKLVHMHGRQHGFTLIELMVTISMLAILLMIAVPSFQSQIASARLSSAVNSFSAALAGARADAIRKGVRVTVCRSDATNLQCTTVAGTGWQGGWITFTDTTRITTNPTVETGETITLSEQALANDLKVSGNSDMTNYVSYSPTGETKTYAGGFGAGTIRFCSTSAALSDSDRARDITISRTGRVVVTKVATESTTCTPI